MSFWKYLSDRKLTLLAWLTLAGLTVFMIWLTPGVKNFWRNVPYLLLLQFFVLLAFLVFDYFHRSSYWRKLEKNSEQKLQRYVEGARSHEERLIQAYINDQVNEHRQEMQEMLDNQQDQKDYIDSWIHEIKVPLAANDLILRSIEDDIDYDKYVLLENEWQKIDEYVDQVMYYARLDNFSQDYLIQDYSLKKILQPIIRSQANYFIQKNLRLEQSEQDEQVLTDAKWVGYIFRQLLSNAIKYTPAGGTIKIDIERSQSGVALRLQDSGIGIPPEDLARIFDKGFTGENGRRQAEHSTGLGLYLAKKLAEKLGVQLLAESTVGVGTTMTLFFPALSYYTETK